jgi:hypothetical protein
MGDLRGTGFAVAEKDRLYRCLDRILPHKAALFAHRRERWQERLQARFDVLLDDLTSTSIEGEGEQIPIGEERRAPGLSQWDLCRVRRVPTAGADEGAGSEPDQPPDEDDGGNMEPKPLE